MSISSGSTIRPALTGSCQCGKVTYSSSVLPTDLTNCHCKTCRKLSGAPYLTFAGFPVSAITYSSDSSSLTTTRYSEIADRTHCSTCGTPISMQYKCQPENISITAGSIDEESLKAPLPKVSQHIFLSEKASWFEIPGDEKEKCQKFEKFSTNFQKKVDGWKKVFLSPGLG
ncbi:Mss4-like protein [Leptodontidium sp. 2 PMI_412]|nr:Mss4-like protein [Leptodontidium sp. MPI-SDFR-AT-0119]KAH9223383.1 Mss4-like protein [Leptodontidium sp. 2 PMI_412]